MDTASVAKTTRAARGIQLFREYGDSIEVTRGGTYRVPSASGRDAYVVYEQYGFCSCVDSRHARKLGEVCKHFTAARICASKRRAARRARRDDTLDAHFFSLERLR